MKLEVVIIDDDPIITLIESRMVIAAAIHHKPISFANGQLGLDFILNNTEPDTTYFILLDINMPVMNGWEFLDAIHQTAVAHQVLVAVVTSSTDEADKQKAHQYPQVIGYIEKPINIQKLNTLTQTTALSPFFTPAKN